MNVPNRFFEIAGGSITGSAHVHAGRNNQDAFAWATARTGLVAIVCDGCSSAAHSEIGAGLIARLFARAGAQGLDEGLAPREIVQRARHEVLAQCRVLAIAMSREGGGEAGAVGSFQNTVASHFLCTVVGVVADDATVTTFSIGDGLIVINGERHRLGPFPDNAPPYLGYDLLGGASALDVHRTIPRTDVDSLVIGTDGANDLPSTFVRELGDDARVFRNTDMVRRRLTVLSRGETRLVDDTSLVVLRRVEVDA